MTVFLIMKGRSDKLNIANINQRQFDNTMQREGIIVTDYYDTLKEYEVFFRRNNRGTTPQGKTINIIPYLL